VDSGILDFHAPQHHFHGHIGKRLLRTCPAKTKSPVLTFSSCRRICSRSRGQWHAMFPPGFHSVGWNRPDFLIEVDF